MGLGGILRATGVMDLVQTRICMDLRQLQLEGVFSDSCQVTGNCCYQQLSNLEVVFLNGRSSVVSFKLDYESQLQICHATRLNVGEMKKSQDVTYNQLLQIMQRILETRMEPEKSTVEAYYCMPIISETLPPCTTVHHQSFEDIFLMKSTLIFTQTMSSLFTV